MSKATEPDEPDGRAGPLAGVRVLDFSRVLSGPLCGRGLADLGADVIKVEPPAGDLSRFANPKVNSLALYYVQQNSGKRNISLDLERPEAADLLRRLAARADVVLENFRPGVMARMGLGYDALAARNPALVYASLTGYGQDGPWANRRAYAVVTQAEVGLTDRILRHWGAEATPRNDAFSHADVYAGLVTLSGILAALLQRAVTGLGQHIDVSMAQAMLFANEHVQDDLSGIDLTGAIRSLGGGQALVFDTASGRRITVAGHPCAPGTFEPYCAAMGRYDLAHDPRFADVAERLAHRSELEGIIRDWVRSFDDLDRLEAHLVDHGFAVGVVRSVAEVAETAWARERGAIANVSDRRGGTLRIPQAPWRFSGASAEVRGAPAYRGEHNRSVFSELLGLDDAELDRLEAAGVLSSRIPARP